mmetsp:Transcript_36545/g.97663  ORF Transcript_36545/g.97663 Transcript_36545/m.97663 type:complete len:227 (+) Transcript_36545:1179-1859(+)
MCRRPWLSGSAPWCAASPCALVGSASLCSSSLRWLTVDKVDLFDRRDRPTDLPLITPSPTPVAKLRTLLALAFFPWCLFPCACAPLALSSSSSPTTDSVGSITMLSIFTKLLWSFFRLRCLAASRAVMGLRFWFTTFFSFFPSGDSPGTHDRGRWGSSCAWLLPFWRTVSPNMGACTFLEPPSCGSSPLCWQSRFISISIVARMSRISSIVARLCASESSGLVSRD